LAQAISVYLSTTSSFIIIIIIIIIISCELSSSGSEGLNAAIYVA